MKTLPSFIFKVMLIATATAFLLAPLAHAVLAAKDLPSWPARHRHKFNLFEAEMSSTCTSQTPTCNLKISKSANASIFQYIEDAMPPTSNNNNNNNKEIPKLQVFFASDLPQSGSGTLMMTEFLKEFATSKKFKLDDFFSPSISAAKKQQDNNKKLSAEELDKLHQFEKNQLLLNASHDFFPSTEQQQAISPSSSSSSSFQIGPSVLLYHEKQNVAFLFVDLSSPLSALSFVPKAFTEGAPRCYSHARSLLHLIPGVYRIQSIPYAFPQPTYEQIESESRAASLIRLSLMDRGIGIVVSASNDMGYQHRKIIKIAFDENNQHKLENSMDVEQRVFSRAQNQLDEESRIQRRLEEDLRDAKTSSSSSSSALATTTTTSSSISSSPLTQQDQDRLLLQLQISQLKLRPDFLLHEMTGFPAGLALGVFSEKLKSNTTEVPVDRFIQISPNEKCVDAAKRLKADMNQASIFNNLDVNAARCRFFKGTRKEFKGKVFAGVHSYDHECSLLEKERRNRNSNDHSNKHSWFYFLFHQNNNQQHVNCTMTSSTKFAHLLVNKMVSFDEDEMKQELHKDHKLNDLYTNLVMLNGVTRRLAISGYPDTPTLFAAWDETVKRQTIEYARMFLQISSFNLIDLHRGLVPVVGSTTSSSSSSTHNNKNQQRPRSFSSSNELIYTSFDDRKHFFETFVRPYLTRNEPIRTIEAALGKFSRDDGILPIIVNASDIGKDDEEDLVNNNNNNNQQTLDSRKSSSASSLLLRAPLTAEEFDRYKISVINAAMEMFDNLCFNDCDAKAQQELQRASEEIVEVTRLGVSDHFLHFMDQYSARCVEFVNNVFFVAVFPIPHALFKRWAEEFRRGCPAAFNHEFAKYKSMIHEKIYIARGAQLVAEIDEKIQRKHEGNYRAVEDFAKPVGAKARAEVVAELEKVNDYSKQAVPASVVRRRCAELVKEIGPRFTNLAQTTFTKSSWLIDEPNYTSWVDFLQHQFETENCEIHLKKNQKLVKEHMNRQVGRFVEFARNSLEAKIRLPLLTASLQEQMSAIFTNAQKEFNIVVERYSTEETSEANDALEHHVKDLGQAWTERNTKLFSDQIQPVKTCTFNRLKNYYNQNLEWYHPSLYFASFWPKKLGDFAQICYHQHLEGKLSSRMISLPESELDRVFKSWHATPEFELIISAANGNFYVALGFIVAISVIVFGIYWKFIRGFINNRRRQYYNVARR